MKRLNLFLLFSAFALSVLTLSCRRETEFETVDYRDIVPTSERDYKEGLDRDTSVQDIWSNNFAENSLDSFLLQNIPELKLKEEEDSYAYFPDRLSYTSKWARVLNIDSVFIHTVKWTFLDSVTTENAFYNWLDCFGNSCISLRVGDKVNFSDKNSLLFVGENEIVFLESDNYNNLDEISDVIFERSNENWKYILEQKAGKTANWLVLPSNVKATEL